MTTTKEKKGASCRVCSHPERAEIERRADDGDSLRVIASDYELSERGLQRHYATHGRVEAPPSSSSSSPSKPPGVAAESTAREVIAELLKRVRKLMQDAEADPLASYRDRSALLTTAGTVAKLLGQLTGEFAVSEASIVASPQWRRIETAIAEALEPYPKAAAAVAKALEGLV